jgi:hypothetical protein
LEIVVEVDLMKLYLFLHTTELLTLQSEEVEESGKNHK